MEHPGFHKELNEEMLEHYLSFQFVPGSSTFFKDVYALPGPVTSALSQGCHRLIRQGAGILITPEELMDEWNLNRMQIGQKNNKNEKMLESPEYMVYSCVGLYPKSVGQLTEETKLRPEEVLKLLVSLELQGYIREISKNYYIKVK